MLPVVLVSTSTWCGTAPLLRSIESARLIEGHAVLAAHFFMVARSAALTPLVAVVARPGHSSPLLLLLLLRVIGHGSGWW